MPGTGAEFAPRLDLAALGDVAAQAWDVLVIDLADVVDAETADLAPPAEAAATAAAWPTPARTTRTAATRTAPGPTRTTGALPLGASAKAATRGLAIGTAHRALVVHSGFVVAHCFLSCES